MSKKLFTDQEQRILKKHPYVKAVSEKGITYTDEFKAIAIKRYEEGINSREIFEDAGFDIDIVGIQRAKSALKRWRAAYKVNTYLSYGKGKRANLSTVKDAETNEILAYEVSDKITLDTALNTMKKLKKNGRRLADGAFIHSDQGVHYTSPQFQKLVKKMGLGQSISRRGNCWDNAPQESFFGHFKDEIDMKSCETLEDVKRKIKSYMTYYNHYRGQWNLKRMTPVQNRHHLLQVS